MAPRPTDCRGFTLIELLIGLVIGVIVMMAASSFAIATMRSVEGNQYREGVHRSARFVGMSLERDFQGTGVGLSSTPSFGALSVQSDTIYILSAAFYPDDAVPHDLDPPNGTDNPLPPGGTCGARCVDVDDEDFEIEVGDLARLQVNDERRLILVERTVEQDESYAIGFTDATELLGQAAGLSGGLLLDRFGTFVQKLSPVAYYLDGDRLMRAAHLTMDGLPDGEVMAEGVTTFDVSVMFVDGDEAERVDPHDSDPTNDFDDLVGIRIRAVFSAEAAAGRGRDTYTRAYEWRFSPRNLAYERNRG